MRNLGQKISNALKNAPLKSAPLKRAARFVRAEAEVISASLRGAEARRFMVLAAFTLIIVLVGADAAHAQTTSVDGGKVTETLRNFADTVYFEWRIPISIIGLFIAALAWMSSSPQGKSWALRIFVAVVIWALIPTFIDLVSGWTGTTGNNNIGGTPGT